MVIAERQTDLAVLLVVILLPIGKAALAIRSADKAEILQVHGRPTLAGSAVGTARAADLAAAETHRVQAFQIALLD